MQNRNKIKTVNAYLMGKLLAKDLVKIALKQNKYLSDIKTELKETYPNVVFRVEFIGDCHETIE